MRVPQVLVFVESYADGSTWRIDAVLATKDASLASQTAKSHTDAVEDPVWGWSGKVGQVALFSGVGKDAITWF